jgi:hypothetical protein
VRAAARVLPDGPRRASRAGLRVALSARAAAAAAARVGAPVLLAAGAAGLKLAIAARVPGPWLFSESTLVARQATALARQGLDALAGPAREYTILYPLLLAPAFALADRADAHAAALALNALVSSSALVPIHAIARRVLPAGTAAAVALLVVVLPTAFVHALALSAENLFFPLFWWGTWLLLRFAERDRMRDAVAAGLVLGLLPAVRLPGFAVLAAAALLAGGMAVFHRVAVRSALACVAALVAPQVLWILIRVAFASPDRGLFGFGPGVGEALVGGLARVREAGGRRLAAYFIGETTYFLVGAYVAWVLFSLYLVSQYRTWRSRSVEGFLLLWTFACAACLAVVTVTLLFPIAGSLTDPELAARPIYGRFIETLFPGFFVLGTRGMLDFAWKERAPRAPRREVLLLLALVVFSAVSVYPLTGYGVASALRPYAWSRLGSPAALVAGAGGLVALGAALAAVAARMRAAPTRGRLLAAGIGAALALQAVAFAVTVGGAVAGARARDAHLFRGARLLSERISPSATVVWDRALGFGTQWFGYRFWVDGAWDARPGERLLDRQPEVVITRRSLPLPLLAEEANGVRVYFENGLEQRGRP